MRFGMLQNSINGVANQILDSLEQLLKVNERPLAFDVSVLGQMAASTRGLGSVGLRNAEHVAQCWTGRLQIKL